jgi:aspartokinase/homoserine dehydrogenase 1
MEPAVARGIPIRIRNSFNAAHPGSVIRAASAVGRREVPVSGFSTVDRVALVNVEGTGMIGVPGVAQRIFGALREVGVSVMLISQASSEHSVCFAVPEAQGNAAREAVEKAFARSTASRSRRGRACWPPWATRWRTSPAWRRASSRRSQRPG